MLLNCEDLVNLWVFYIFDWYVLCYENNFNFDIFIVILNWFVLFLCIILIFKLIYKVVDWIVCLVRINIDIKLY